MKKLYSIFTFILFLVVESFGQPQIDISIHVHDNAGEDRTIYFGLDMFATDGIDPQLGEYDISSLPSDLLDARWFLPPFDGSISSFRDYRAPGNPLPFPFTGNKLHVIHFQTTNYPVTFSWSLPWEIAPSSTIQYNIGGQLYTVSFSQNGSLTITDSTVTQLYFSVDYLDIFPPDLPPAFQIFPFSLNFDSVAIGTFSTLQSTIVNMAVQDLIIYDITSSDEQFTFVPNTLPITIPVGGILQIDITFTPTMPGMQTTDLIFLYNLGPVQTIDPLHGIGVPAVQPAVDIPLSATDGTETYALSIGLDLTATNCIDPQLGEHDINWGPPTNMFKISFDLQPYGCPPGTDSFKDYRAPGNPPAFPFTGMIQHTLWWQTSAPALPIDITYNLPPGTLMFITDQIGGSFLNLGPFTGQGTATIPGTYTNIFSKALLKMQYVNIISVELTSFTSSVLQYEKAIQLNWTTATETNNSGFEILRFAQNDSEWETIGFVEGHGTTTEPKSYLFTDEDVTTGKYKYRLKQIDFDGSFNYSNEIEVETDFTPKEFVLYQNYPNPFNPSTKIKFAIPKETQVNLNVYNLLGEKVREIKNEIMQLGYYEIEFDGYGLASGVYIYRLTADSFSEAKKLVLTK